MSETNKTEVEPDPDTQTSVQEDLVDRADGELEGEFEDAVQDEDAYDEAAYDEIEDDLHDERGMSWSSRLLLALLLLLGGGALALWGGPRLAPHLPAWASPAVPYLVPGADQASVQVDGLRSELEERLAALESAPGAEAVKTEIAGELSALRDETDTKLSALGDTVASSDGGSVEARLSQLETRIEGIDTRVESIATSITALGDGGGALSADAAAQLTANASSLDGIRAEVSALAAKTGTLSQRIDDVQVAAERRVEEAKAEATEIAQVAEQSKVAAELESKLGAISQALDEGGNYADPLSFVAANSAVTIPEALSGPAETGVAALDTLREEFDVKSHAVIKSSIRDQSSDGAMGKLGSFLRSQVATRSVKPIEGDSLNAVLSRMTAQLSAGDLGAVLAESTSLDDFSKAYLSDWLEQVTTRHRAVVAFGNLASEIS